jgi:hypothetical protein
MSNPSNPSNLRAPFRLIAPKTREPSQELSRESSGLLQEPLQGYSQELFVQNPDIIAVALPRPSSEIQEVTPLSSARVPKKKTQKTEKTGLTEEETGWNDESTGLLLSFLEENFTVYKKNKSSFAKLAATKIFPGKLWEQIKNKLSRLVNRYNEIKEKENQTGREAQAKWKWFDRLDVLFGTRENHNPGFLVDGFSDDVQIFDSSKEKEIKEEILTTEIKDSKVTKKRKSFSQDPLAEAIVSMGNARQIIWEKKLALESEQFSKRQEFEKQIKDAEVAFKREELEVERIRAETLQKKMEFEIEQSRMEYQLKIKELELKMLQFSNNTNNSNSNN